MLELRQIEEFYPEYLRHFKRNLLREYLQFKILAAIYASRYASKLAFMGGTAIHIVHGAQRFSEDLDFDNKGLTQGDFRSLTQVVAAKLSREGLSVEAGNSFKGAFSADIKIKGLLFESGISGHRQEKVLVKLDAEPQEYKYAPERFILNKFDVLSGIGVVPVDILLAQKFFAILMRKRAMGRDFFDAMFLAGKAKPDFGYLKARAGIPDMEGLKPAILRKCATLDFKQLAQDAAPLLFSSGDARKILLFPEFVGNL
jgi:hypothetical protein